MIRINQTIYKYITLLALLILLATSCSANPEYRQIKIPLGADGVPFYKEGVFIYLEGFDVDKDGNFYFLGGEKATLACYSGTTLKFRKKYDEFNSGQIYLIDRKLYLFDIANKKNNLVIIDIPSGSILSRKDSIIKNWVNSYIFRDSCLIIQVFDNKKEINMSTQLAFAQFDLGGRFVKQVDNRFNLPTVLYPNDFELYGNLFLGVWEGNYIYCNIDIDTKSYKFTMRDIEGKLLHTTNIDEKIFGKIFFGNPYEHEKLRNGNIYILGRDEKNAIITVLPIKELFNLN